MFLNRISLKPEERSDLVLYSWFASRGANNAPQLIVETTP